MTEATKVSTTTSTISDEELSKFSEFFYRKTGILFEKNKRYFVERRLIDRIADTGCLSFREYFSLVRFEASGKELQHLVNQMTVNETYFYREDYQFKALVEGILPEIAPRKQRSDSIRIWSLPCSTGEEPYSIAMYLLENWPAVDRYDIEILASDIDSNVLAVARKGIYGTRSLQRLSAGIMKRYFAHAGDEDFQICDLLRNSIEFSQGNVIDGMFTRKFRNIDVVFCRNMLIYFDDASRREAIEALYDCLAPGGYICLGHSESMSRISSLFTPVKFADSIVYKKIERT